VTLRFAIAAAAALVLSVPASAATLRDDLGRTVSLRLPVRRVVSLAPSASENLVAIGAGSRIVGVISADDTPAVQKLPRVGDFYAPSVERVRVLRPDVVLVDSVTADRATMDRLQARLQTPVFVQRSRRFDDVPRHLLQLGRITGANASRAAAAMRAKAAQAARRVAGKGRPTVFVQIGASPLYAAGPGSFVDDLIRRAGGTNVVRGTTSFPQYSKETLLAADPAHYVIAGSPGNTTLPPPLDRLSAARRGNVHRIPADLLLRPTPRLADGLALLARALHP
jgi:iron complex transport system substrate-binding protein